MRAGVPRAPRRSRSRRTGRAAPADAARPRPGARAGTAARPRRRPRRRGALEPAPPGARDCGGDREGARRRFGARRPAWPRLHAGGAARHRPRPRRDGRHRGAPARLRPDRRRTERRGGTAVSRGRRRRGSALTPGAPAVEVSDLRKRYGEHEAVRGISFAIQPGEVFSLLGPNGAGKTTTVEILEGYRRRDAGTVAVLGEDPARGTRAWRGRIGVVLQSSAMYETLTVRESLAAFAGYYERPRPVDDVVRVVGLDESADVRVSKLSGGQRRRLDFGLALVGDPELIFLDEPTTGFDPAARRTAWETIRSLKELGKTILLTTHYLDEAEQLADRVAVLRQGQIVTIGSPAELRGGSAETEIRYRLNGQDVVLRTSEPTRVLHELNGAAVAAGREVEALEVRRPTLEDIYLDLTAENGE